MIKINLGIFISKKIREREREREDLWLGMMLFYKKERDSGTPPPIICPKSKQGEKSGFNGKGHP